MFSRGRFPRSSLIATISIFGIGVLSYGIVDLVRYLEASLPSTSLPLLVALLGVGFGIILGAGGLQQYWKRLARRAPADTVVG